MTWNSRSASACAGPFNSSTRDRFIVQLQPLGFHPHAGVIEHYWR